MKFFTSQARALAIGNKMKAHGKKMEKLVIVEKLLRSMTSWFEFVVCSIEESNKVGTMSIDELQSIPWVHGQRMKGIIWTKNMLWKFLSHEERRKMYRLNMIIRRTRQKESTY